MNIYTTLLLYIFLLLNNNLVDSLSLQFKFKGSKKINDKNGYWLLRVNENEGHYFFYSLTSCTKVVADGKVLWSLEAVGMCPRAVSYYGTDEVAINFPEKLLVFKKRNGKWEHDPTLKNVKIELTPNAPVVESDRKAKEKPDHPASKEVELSTRLRKEPDYDVSSELKHESEGEENGQKTEESTEQEPNLTSPETAQSGTDVSSAEPALPESE